jgi:hypothetical protein
LGKIMTIPVPDFSVVLPTFNRPAPLARCLHANDLTFPAFWRQPTAYGRGAGWFYRAHRNRCAGESTIRWSYCVALPFGLASRILRQERHRLKLAFLMAVRQMANFVGFLQAILSPILSVPGGGGS